VPPDPGEPDWATPGADPVFVLCAARSGSTLLRFLLDAHPDLACPPETRLSGMCAQTAEVWSIFEEAPDRDENDPDAARAPEAALAGLRRTVDEMVGPYLRRRGKRRFCDKSLGTAQQADLLVRLFPGARFICLYRHPMDVIASGIEASPWGLSGFGFDSYAAAAPGNTVLALAQFWADNAALILGAEQRFAERCHRVRYEDLVADPEAVADGIFKFLGVPAAPGVSRACFGPERELVGPSDYKIWHTSQVNTDSVGRGWTLPANLIGPAVTATVNSLTERLGYIPVGPQWGIAPVPPDFRQEGTRPQTAGRRRASRHFPPGYRVLGAGLEAGVARRDEAFRRQWEPCSQETFLVTATPPGGGTATRWRADLAAGTVQVVAGMPPGMGDARWDIVGPADVWEQVVSGDLNLSVAVRQRRLRYCDAGDSGAIPRIRISMLADLLDVTAWRPAAPDAQPR
jgi:Sulfotransferase family